MNKKREAILWSMMVTISVVLGLIVVWGAVVLAFRQTVLAPLYFVAAPYHQDDYSAEGVNAVRFNRLDPALEQEALREDSMRDRLTASVAASPTLQHQSSPTKIRSTPSKQPPATSTRMATRTIFPLYTKTSRPVSTHINLPSRTVVTNTPKASKTPLPPPNTQKPPDTPKPPPNTQKPPNTPPPPNTRKPPNTPKPPPNTPKPPKHHRHAQSLDALVLLGPANGLHIKCEDDPIDCSGGSSSIVRTKYLSKWFTLRLAQFI